jgi:O-antigen/teichoic acid export membrane protein
MSKIKEKIKNLLIAAQRYTKTDNIYLAKYGSILLSGNVLAGILSFLVSLAFAKFMSKTDYGSYRLIVSAVGTVGILTLPGMYTAIQKAVAQGKEGSIKEGVKTKIKFGFIASVVLVGFGCYYFFFKKLPSEIFISFLLIALSIPFVESYKLYGAYLAGKKLFRESTLYGVSGQAIYSLILILTLVIKPRLIPIVAVFALGNAIINWWFYKKAVSKFPTNNEVDHSAMKYGKQLSLMDIIPTIAKYIDSFLTFSLLGPAALANYSFATIPADKLGLITNPILTLAFPKFAQKSREELRSVIYKKWAQMFLFALAVIIPFIVLLPLAFKFLFPRYLDVVTYARIYALTFLTVPNGLILTAFSAHGMVKELTIIQLFSSITQIILMSVLIYFYGIWGLIWASVIVTFLKSFVFLALAKRI